MLKFPRVDRLARLTTQMKFRMEEGINEAYYYIGVKDNGETVGVSAEEMELSLRTLHRMAWTLKFNLTLRSISKGQKGEIAKVMVIDDKVQCLLLWKYTPIPRGKGYIFRKKNDQHFLQNYTPIPPTK